MHTYISDITKSYLGVIRSGEITQWLGHLDLIWLKVGPFVICFVYRSRDENSFFGIPYLKRALQELFHELLRERKKNSCCS